MIHLSSLRLAAPGRSSTAQILRQSPRRAGGRYQSVPAPPKALEEVPARSSLPEPMICFMR